MEVECVGYCEEDHCEEQEGSCPHHPVSPEWLQTAFNRTGPLRDRYTDWFRCREEPWVTLAECYGSSV